MSFRSNPEREKIECYAATRRFYDENSKSYAEATLGLSMGAVLETFALRMPQGQKIADLGCGSGRDLRELSRLGCSAIGLDVSKQMARFAAAYSGCPVVVADLRSLPLATDSFGGAWASASLLHLRRDDIRIALSEIARILQPDGYFFSSIKCGQGEEVDLKGRLFTYFQSADWRSQLGEMGFDIVDSLVSLQASGTLEKEQSVTWFNCTAKIRK